MFAKYTPHSQSKYPNDIKQPQPLNTHEGRFLPFLLMRYYIEKKIKIMKKEEAIKRYDGYSSLVKEWMNNLINDLYDELGELPSSYIMQLDLLAQNCEILMKSKNELDKSGLVLKDPARGNIVKNPATAIYNSSMLSINKILNQFAVTRMAKSKLKNIDTDEASPIDAFL